MVFQGLDQRQAEASGARSSIGSPRSPQDFSLVSRAVRSSACRRGTSGIPTFLKQHPRPRARRRPPGRARGQYVLGGRSGQAGQVLHGYQSAWLPASLLQTDAQRRLADALFAATRHWGVSLHVNKGLAGAPAEAIDGRQGHGDEPGGARRLRAASSAAPRGRRPIPASPATSPTSRPRAAHARGDRPGHGRAAQAACRTPAPTSRRATSSSADWQRSFWGTNYARLLGRKGQVRSRTACSSSTTASAASAGAPTDSSARPDRNAQPLSKEC